MRPAATIHLALALTVSVAAAHPAAAQSITRSRISFVGGAVTALAAHETGHAIFDLAFGAHPYIHTVHFGRIPFFAVAQRDDVTPRQEYVIASAGFWVQHATSELILTTHPNLRREHAPFMKGALAFNVLLSSGYAVSAFFKAGPAERDPRSMAVGINVSEPAIGALILAPAVLDAYRYARPDARWAAWASRVVKVGAVALAFR